MDCGGLWYYVAYGYPVEMLVYSWDVKSTIWSVLTSHIVDVVSMHCTSTGQTRFITLNYVITHIFIIVVHRHLSVRIKDTFKLGCYVN